MARQSSFRRRFAKMAKPIIQAWSERCRRWASLFSPGALSSDRPSSPIVGGLRGGLRPASCPPGLLLRRLRLESLERRQLLAANPLYVAPLLADANPGSNYWVDPSGAAVTSSTAAGVVVHSADNLVTGQYWQETAFHSLSDALDAATGGTPGSPLTVDILPGTYTSASGVINVAQPYVTIEGDASSSLGTTIVAPNGGFEIGAAGITVNNLVITGGASAANPGISVTSSGANVTIQNSLFEGNVVGIDVNGGSAMVSGNQVYDNTTGIEFVAGGSGSVTGNDFTFPPGSSCNATDLLLANTAGTVTLATANSSGNIFAGTTYIDNESSQSIDATHDTFGTVAPTDNSLAELYGVEDQITDAIDASGLGLVRIRDGNLYVTPSSYVSPATDATGAVARAAAAASLGDTINVDTTLSFSNLSSATITYGDATAALGGDIAAASWVPVPVGSVAITVNGNTDNAVIASSTGAFSDAFPTVDLDVAGSPYTITYAYTGGTSGSLIYNYSTGTSGEPISDASQTLTVNKAVPTVVATDAGGIYSASAYPASATVAGVGSDSTPAAALESVGTTFTYYVGNDTTGTDLGSAAPTAAGTYTVVSHFAGSADYTSADSQPMTFTIAPATLTVTADAETKVYGQSDPAFTYEVSGLQPGDQVSDVLSGALGRVAGETVDGGPYAISQGTLACNDNYTIAFAGNTLTITPATLTVTAAAETKVYGQSDPALAYLATGYQFGDSGATVLTGGLSRVAGETVDGGPYAISQGTLACNDNYTIAFAGNTLTVTPATATISVTPYSVTYDGNPHTATVVATGVGGANLGNSVNLSGTTHTNAAAYAADSWSFSNPNYVDQSGTVSDNIATCAITVTANSGQSKVYGQYDAEDWVPGDAGSAPPAFTYTVTSGNLVGNDSFTGALSRVAGDSVGSYPITLGTLTAGGNYNVTYDTANFTINPPTVGVSGSSTTLDGSQYALTLNPVPTVFAAAGDATFWLAVTWNDPISQGISPTNPNVVFVAPPGVPASGDGTGPGQLLPFPANGVLAHDYTEATANTSGIHITVDLITGDTAFYDAGVQTVSVVNVAPTARVTASPTATVGGTAYVALSNPYDPSPEDTAAGFHYAYQVYYGGNLLWSQGSTASYAGGVTNSALTIPAQYLEAPGVTVDASIIDEDGGCTQYSQAIPVDNAALSVSTGGNLAATAGSAFTQSVTFNYPDTTGLSPFAAYLYLQGNPTPLATVSGVQPGVPFSIGSTFASSGPNTLYVTVSDTVGASGSSSTFNVTVQNPVLTVTSFTPLTSGFAVTFNRPVNTSLLNLYDGLIPDSVSPQNPNGINNSFGAADVTLVGQNTGAVRGSLVWNSATDTASFVKTDAVLAPDTYTVTLYSRANGWVDAATGGLLSGGTNYTATFTVAASNAVVLSMPCFARGPNQPLNVADNGTAGAPGNFASGLPIHISNGAGVTAVDFTLRYDPTLLNIGGVSLTSAVPASGGWGVTYNNTVPGTLIVSMSGSASLPSGGLDILTVLGGVPGTAPYGATEVLSLGNIRVNGGQIAAVNSNQALHKAAYLGDANGNETLDAYDSFYISRVSVGLDSGFYAYPLTDPLIIGDVSGEATLSGLDASYVLEKSVGESVAQIPSIPSTKPASIAGVDPTVAIPTGLVGVRGQTVDSTVAITDNAASLAGASFFIDYPTNFVGIDATQVALSSYMASQGFTLVAYSPSPGQLNVGMYNSKGTFSNYGAPQLFTMPFDVLLSAPSGTAPITFDPTGGSTLNGGYLTMTPVNGSIIIGGPYNWIGGTGANGQANDWSTEGNWDADSDPNGATTSTVFGNAGATGTVVLDSGNRTVGAITFSSSTPTTITTTAADGGALTLDNGPNAAAISVSGSGHTVASLVGVTLNSSVVITVIGSGDSLAIAGNIGDGADGPAGITLSGEGTLILCGANSYSGGTVVAGGVLAVTSASALPNGGSLIVGAGAADTFAGATSAADQASALAAGQSDAAISTATTAPATTTADAKIAAPPASPLAAAAVTVSLTTAPSPISSLVGNPVRVESKISGPSAVTAPSLPAPGVTAKAHDAVLQAWTVRPSARDPAWLAAAYDGSDQSQPEEDSSIAAWDEAIIRYAARP